MTLMIFFFLNILSLPQPHTQMSWEIKMTRAYEPMWVDVRCQIRFKCLLHLMDGRAKHVCNTCTAVTATQ